MDKLPHTLAGWLRYGLVSSFTACLGLLNYLDVTNRIQGHYYFNQDYAGMALWVSLGIHFLISLALLPLNRSLAVFGILSSIVILGLIPLVSVIKQ